MTIAIGVSWEHIRVIVDAPGQTARHRGPINGR